jgi:hypothetical protein
MNKMNVHHPVMQIDGAHVPQDYDEGFHGWNLSTELLHSSTSSRPDTLALGDLCLSTTPA